MKRGVMTWGRVFGRGVDLFETWYLILHDRNVVLLNGLQTRLPEACTPEGSRAPTARAVADGRFVSYAEILMNPRRNSGESIHQKVAED